MTNMYVTPSMPVQAVAPLTIGTFLAGLYDESYGYTSAVRCVYERTQKLLPRQHVSAFVSASLFASVPGFGSLEMGSDEAAAKRLEDMVNIILDPNRTIFCCTLIHHGFASQDGGRERSEACSFLPPITVPPVVVRSVVISLTAVPSSVDICDALRFFDSR